MIAVGFCGVALGIGELSVRVVGELDVLRSAERLERTGALLGLVERVPAGREEHDAHECQSEPEPLKSLVHDATLCFCCPALLP